MAADRNLLANADFEQAPADDPARGWTPDEKMKAQILRLDSKERLSGRHGLAIEMARAFGKGTNAALSQSVSVRPNTWYIFRANYKRDNFVYGGSFVVALYKGQQRVSRHAHTFRSETWETERIVFNSEQADRAEVSVIVSCDGTWRISVGGTVWLDDLSLVELSDDLNLLLPAAGARVARGPKRDGDAIAGTGAGAIDFDVQAKATGDYYLWLRWHLPAESRSVAQVRVDDGPPAQVGGYRTGEWAWTRPVTPRLFLSAGRHRVRFEDLATGARLAEIRLSPNPYYYPPGVERAYSDGPARARALREKGRTPNGRGQVALRVLPPTQGPRLRTTWPLAQGVPFPRGHVADDTPVRLSDASGKALPVQAHALARWPDGSVQWLLVQTIAPIDAADPGAFRLEYGREVKPYRPRWAVRVRDLADRVSVNTGALQFLVLKTGFRFLDSLHVDLDGDGQFRLAEQLLSGDDLGGCFVNDEYDSRNATPREVTVEEAGPVRAVIKVAGTHVNAAGEESLDYVVRIHAYAGQRLLRIEHTFIARHDNPGKIDLNEVALRLPLRLSPDAKVTLGADGDQSIECKIGKGVRLVQDGDYDSRNRKGWHKFQVFSGKREIGSGNEAAGYARIDTDKWSALVGIRHFWQNYPKGFDISPRGLSIQLVPPRAGTGGSKQRPCAFYHGMAKTHEVLLDFTPRDQAAAQLEHWRAFTGWPVMLAEPAWIASTGALGRPGALDRQNYAAYEHQIDDVFDHYATALARDRKSGVALGLINFGDKRGDGGYNNLETALGEGMLLQFFRTGERKYLDFADAAIRHFSDIDIDHSESSAGGIYVHGRHKRPGKPRDNFGLNGHSWFVGVRNFYYLTGERRLRDQAQQVGEYYLARPFPLLPTIHSWRGIAWPGMCMLSAYEITGDARFLEGAGHVVEVTDYQKDHIVTLWPYMFAVGTRVVRWYWEKTEDPAARALFLHLVDEYLARRTRPGDPSFGADPKEEGMLLGNYPAARELNFYNQLAWAARLTGNEDYVRLGAGDINIQTKFRLVSDVLLWGSADLIGEMQRLRIPGARHYAGLRWVYCVHEPRMMFQIEEQRDGPFVVNLYTSRSGKYCMDYGAAATLYDPKGKPIRTLPVRTGGLREFRFDVPADGQAGIYTLVVDVEDFWRWTLDRIAFDLQPGEHVLEVAGHPGKGKKLRGTLKKAKLDKWMLTTDSLCRPHRDPAARRKAEAYIAVEAESGQLEGSMTACPDRRASGGRFVQDVVGPPGAGRAAYRFTVTRAGKYHFYARVGLLSVLNNRLFLRMDDGQPVQFGRIDPMSNHPFPLWSVFSSLGPEAVTQYWYEPGHKGATYYRAEHLKPTAVTSKLGR